MKITIVYSGVVPSVRYGGVERVLWGLARELVARGHRVCFLVEKGSTCPFAEVRELRSGVPLAEQIPEDTDVVHLNDYVPTEGLTVPYVVTIHGNKPSEPLDPNSIFVSRNHAERFGSTSYVYNGIDWSSYSTPVLSGRRSYFHFLGNAAWKVKNVVGAVETIRKIPDGRLKVLGGYRFNFKMGWRFTFSPKARFYGMVDDTVKQQVIQGSRGLLFPVRWHEPFGLAIIESLYFGAPVFGTPYGSLPELVPRACGFLSNNSSLLAEHMEQAWDSYSPADCHEYAVELFNARVMTDRYLEKYARVLDGEVLTPHFGRRQPFQAPLEWK